MLEVASVQGIVQRKPSPAPQTLEAETKAQPPTPLPVWRIFPLLVQRCSEGLTYAVIFPYVNEMILSFGVPEKSVGFWSGLVEASLMITEAITAPLYAPLADKVGRRPVIVVLLSFWAVGGVAFGLCKHVWSTVLTRGFLGLLAGCGVLSRTMVGEICDKTNRVQGFAIFSPALTIGTTLAPLVGGLLAKPVPRLLPPSYTLFLEYPYLLPALVAAASVMLAFVTCLLFLQETLPASGRSGGIEKNKQASMGELLRYRRFQMVVILYSWGNMIMFMWDAVYPLFSFTSRELGGLGLDTQTIGLILAFSATLCILMTVFVYPYLHKRIPEPLYLKLCFAAYPAAVALFPVIWGVTYRNGGLCKTAYFFLFLQMVLRRIGDFAATMLDTIVLDSIPSPRYIALANSVTFSTAAIGRALGPLIVSGLFSFSTSFQGPLRNIVWIVFAILSLPCIYLASRIYTDNHTQHRHEENVELMGRASSIDNDHDLRHRSPA